MHRCIVLNVMNILIHTEVIKAEILCVLKENEQGYKQKAEIILDTCHAHFSFESNCEY